MRKFTESLNNIKKTKVEKLVYFDLFPLLKGLEVERPGIKDRVWSWMCETGPYDASFAPYNGRISNINLFYFGLGDEYPTKHLQKYKDELEHSKITFPESFIDGSKKELRLDINLIWSVYEDDMIESESILHDPIGMFAVLVQW